MVLRFIQIPWFWTYDMSKIMVSGWIYMNYLTSLGLLHIYSISINIYYNWITETFTFVLSHLQAFNDIFKCLKNISSHYFCSLNWEHKVLVYTRYHVEFASPWTWRIDSIYSCASWCIERQWLVHVASLHFSCLTFVSSWYNVTVDGLNLVRCLLHKHSGLQQQLGKTLSPFILHVPTWSALLGPVSFYKIRRWNLKWSGFFVMINHRESHFLQLLRRYMFIFKH